METNNNAPNCWTVSKNLVLALGLLLTASAAQALPSYEYVNTPAEGSIMNDYSVRWNPNTEVLNISSSWDASANIDKIAFLITDGGSPYLTDHAAKEEQFLWHDLNLGTGVLTVSTYFGGRTPLQTFTEDLTITANSIDLNIDHTSLNSLTFPDYGSYNGMGFSDDIGIWYYMYSNGSLVETLDIHHATPTTVPEPGIFWLVAMGLLVAGASRLMRKKVDEETQLVLA